MVKNIAGKGENAGNGENAGYQHFLLFPYVFKGLFMELLTLENVGKTSQTFYK